MAINNTDIKLYESQRLTDDDDGGGRATGNVVADGAVNNIFPDISRLDRTIGDVALRKTFVGVATANQDSYLGAHAILTKVPLDPKARVLLFNTDSEADERSDARDYIENYVVQGARAAWDLLGSQLQGQRVLVGIQRESQRLPEIGEVYKLVDGSNEQYVRITDIEHSIEQFTYELNGSFIDFERRKLTMDISAPLEFLFPGGEATPSGTTTPKAEVFSTEVADAAQYYGATTLKSSAVTSDVQVVVSDVFESLVPSAQSESAVLDAPAGYNSAGVVAASSVAFSNVSPTVPWSQAPRQIFLNRRIIPGTLVVSTPILGLTTWSDQGGVLSYVSGNASHVFEIDYETGILTYYSPSIVSGSSTITASYIPAGEASGPAETGSQDITLQNRGYVYTLSLPTAKPTPGTIVIAYLALGKWQELRDEGAGVLTGAGTGQVNFQTGSVNMTLANLPDADSKLVWYYQADRAVEYLVGDEVLTIEPTFNLQLDPGVKPGSVSMSWTSGTAQTATDDGAGNITGDATGTVIYASGALEIVLTSPPDAGTSITVDSETAAVTQDIQSPTPNGSGIISGTIPGAPLLPGSVNISWTEEQKRFYANGDQWDKTAFSSTATVAVTAQDDGAGAFVGYVGTINYTTGAYTLQVENDYVFTVRNGTHNSWTATTTTETSTFIGPVVIGFQPQSAVHGAAQNIVTADNLTFDLNDGLDGWVVLAGSLVFSYGGKLHYDLDGIIYRDFDMSTGAGTSVGSISPAEGKVTLTTWESGPGNSVDVKAALYTRGNTQTNVIIFRSPGRPLRSQSVQMTAQRVDTGAAIVATSDANGLISSAEMDGVVDYESGIIEIEFTDGSNDIPVWPGSIRYNAVIQSFLPLDANLIGIDPVRLPVDGRVPIFRDGGVLILSHTESADIGTPVADDVVNLARTFVADAWVQDDNGVLMDPAEYVVDLEAGTITFGNPLTLQDVDTNALATPLHAYDRIEHMTAMTDVQVSGDIGMLAPLAHDYPAGSVASSALLWGDIKSRAFSAFTQKTWNSGSPNWTEDRIGDDTTASYNLVDNPIEITNHGGITEKWALVFTSTTDFQIVGEQVGIIGTGNISSDTAPVNPNTAVPYFVVRSGGWGVGWSSSNVLRFNSEAALGPMWIARTVLPGEATADDDSFTIQSRGDAD
ncbi:hypothetical protein N9J88_03390 [Porticoccaceae bacterium]|nr:hypothetical protein [Porticoccaceae bacterium]